MRELPAGDSLAGTVASSEKAAANGVATLGGDGKVPVGQLPSTAVGGGLSRGKVFFFAGM